MTRTEGGAALFKGLGPALIGTAPYAALNFASYDLLKRGIFGADARCPAQPLRAAVSMIVSSKVCVRLSGRDGAHKAMSCQQHAAAIMQHATSFPRITVPWSVRPVQPLWVHRHAMQDVQGNNADVIWVLQHTDGAQFGAGGSLRPAGVVRVLPAGHRAAADADAHLHVPRPSGRHVLHLALGKWHCFSHQTHCRHWRSACNQCGGRCRCAPACTAARLMLCPASGAR